MPILVNCRISENQGNRAYHNLAHESALDKFIAAKNLSNTYKFEAVDYLDSLILFSANHYYAQFLGDTPKTELITDPSELEFAITKIDEITTASPTCCNGLKKHANALSNLVNSACKVKHKVYTEQLAKAEDNIRNASFLFADSLLQYAVTMTGEYEKCKLDPQPAFELKQEIAHGVGYELTLDKIYAEIESQNYPEAIDQYENLTEYYNLYGLKELGLRHDSLQNFIANTDDITFINFCIGQFSDLDNFELALFLLNNLYLRGINSGLARNGQIALGIILCTKDFKQNSGRPVKEMIDRYTNGDKWFEHFERVYEIRWEKLQESRDRRR